MTFLSSVQFTDFTTDVRVEREGRLEHGEQKHHRSLCFLGSSSPSSAAGVIMDHRIFLGVHHRLRNLGVINRNHSFLLGDYRHRLLEQERKEGVHSWVMGHGYGFMGHCVFS